MKLTNRIFTGFSIVLTFILIIFIFFALKYVDGLEKTNVVREGIIFLCGCKICFCYDTVIEFYIIYIRFILVIFIIVIRKCSSFTLNRSFSSSPVAILCLKTIEIYIFLISIFQFLYSYYYFYSMPHKI